MQGSHAEVHWSDAISRSCEYKMKWTAESIYAVEILGPPPCTRDLFVSGSNARILATKVFHKLELTKCEAFVRLSLLEFCSIAGECCAPSAALNSRLLDVIGWHYYMKTVVKLVPTLGFDAGKVRLGFKILTFPYFFNNFILKQYEENYF